MGWPYRPEAQCNPRSRIELRKGHPYSNTGNHHPHQKAGDCTAKVIDGQKDGCGHQKERVEFDAAAKTTKSGLKYMLSPPGMVRFWIAWFRQPRLHPTSYIPGVVSWIVSTARYISTPYGYCGRRFPEMVES